MRILLMHVLAVGANDVVYCFVIIGLISVRCVIGRLGARIVAFARTVR